MTPVATFEATEAATDSAATAEPTLTRETLVEDEMLVEEISIDGMCGVY